MRDVVPPEHPIYGPVRDGKPCGLEEHACMLLQAGVWVGVELPEELLFMFSLHGPGATRWRRSLVKRACLGLLQVGPDGIAIHLVVICDRLDGFP